MREAPFRHLPGTAPAPAEGMFTTAGDGITLRLALWRPAPARRARASGGGTVLLFPGRTEYCEKYAPVAARLTAAGHAVLAIDWRGQGDSDRLIPDPRPGHVGSFDDYQEDVAALVEAATALGLPQPWHLLAHSMGGCIGLRALMRGLPVASAAFSAPMWGIRFGRLPPGMGDRVAIRVSEAAALSGRATHPVPAASNVLDVAFNQNHLTSDIDEYTRLMREAAAWPELALGPASYGWVRAAVAECRALAALPSPRLPALIGLAGRDRVVLPVLIRTRAATWAGARLLELPESRHEAMFERPAIRETFFGAVLDLFAAPAPAPAPGPAGGLGGAGLRDSRRGSARISPSSRSASGAAGRAPPSPR